MEDTKMLGEEPNEVGRIELGGAGGVSWCDYGAMGLSYLWEGRSRGGGEDG